MDLGETLLAMDRKRLSRADSRERTAQRLMDAAEQHIAAHGLDGTSVEVIAEEAGYSRGAFYSNFRSKEDLFLQVLRRDQERTNQRFANVLDEALPVEQARARVRDLYAALYRDAASFMIWTEARMLSARDIAFREKLAALIAERRDFVVKLIDWLYRLAGAEPAVPVQALAMGLISLMEGVSFFVASCPEEMPAVVAEAILKVFVDAVMVAPEPSS